MYNRRGFRISTTSRLDGQKYPKIWNHYRQWKQSCFITRQNIHRGFDSTHSCCNINIVLVSKFWVRIQIQKYQKLVKSKLWINLINLTWICINGVNQHLLSDILANVINIHKIQTTCLSIYAYKLDWTLIFIFEKHILSTIVFNCTINM